MYRQIIVFLLTFQGLILSQRSQPDFQKELEAQSSAIQSLKDEINATKKRIQSEGRKEKSSVRRVSNLSEEILDTPSKFCLIMLIIFLSCSFLL